MFWFAVAILLVLAAVGMAYYWLVEASRAKRIRQRDVDGLLKTEDALSKARYWAGGAIAVLLVSLIPLCLAILFVQDPGESKVIKNFGGSIARVDDSAGLGFKFPWQTIATFNVRNQRIEMFGGAESANPNIGNDGAAIVAPVRGSANVTISVTVVYSIKEDRVGDIYTEYGNQENLLETALRPNIRDVVRTESARFEPFLIKESREDLEVAVRARLKALWDPVGVTLETINWGDFRLNQATEDALAGVNEAKAKAEQERQNLVGAEFRAEQTRVTAKGDSDSDQIIRCGARTVVDTEIIGGQPTKVTRVVPLPNRQCQNRLNAQVLTARYIEALRLIGEKGNLIVVTSGASGVNPRIDLPLSSTGR